MYKVALFVGLALLAAQTYADTTACCEGAKDCKNIVCQPCTNYTRCPECYPNGANGPRVDFREPCCKQLSQVVALTAASVQASSAAYAAAQAASFAATKVVVAAAAGASVGSFVSIAQTLSLSINTGKCCEISQDVQSVASSYAKSYAAAAAEAKAAAASAASACAAATAASAAASSLYAQAESLIKSSCCGFDLEVYSAVLAAGNYAVKAAACVDVATKVGTAAQDAARVTTHASSESSGYTRNWAQAKIDNCCNNNYTKSVSSSVAGGCLKVVDKARELHGYAEEAFDYVAAYASEANGIETALKLVDEILVSECRDVRVGCCDGGCGKHKRGAYDGAPQGDKDGDGESDDTVGLASRAVAQVFLAAKASAEAAAQAAVYSQSVAQVYTQTISIAYTAARAASGAAASIKISVQNCCSIVITIDTAAFANAKAVGKAFSQAAAAAKAYSFGYAKAQAVSQAIALGVAAAKSTVTAFYSGCCGKSACKESRYLGTGGRLRCCDFTQNVVSAYSREYINLVSNACTSAESLSKSESAAATGARASDCTNLIRRATTKSAFLLQCCCCSTKNVVASTVGYGARNEKNIYFAPKRNNRY